MEKVDIVRNPADFKKLKKQFNIVDKKNVNKDNQWKITSTTKDGHIIRDKVNSRYSAISSTLFGPRTLKRKS